MDSFHDFSTTSTLRSLTEVTWSAHTWLPSAAGASATAGGGGGGGGGASSQNTTWTTALSMAADNVTHAARTNGSDDYDYTYDYETSVSLDSLPLGEVIPVSLVYGFTLIFGLTGNALVIIVVLRNERLRSITNIFLTSLASADLVLVVFCVPIKCVAFFSFTWAFGEFLCKAVHYIQAVSMVCSVMTLTVMSVERNVAILFPLRAKYLCTRGHAQIVIAVIWVLSLAMATPVLVGQKHKEVGQVRKAYWCVREWMRPEVGMAFDVYMFVFLFLLPVSIMAAAYTGIARALWRGSALRRSMTVPSAYTCASAPAVGLRGRSRRMRGSTDLPAPLTHNNHANNHNNSSGQQAHYCRLDSLDLEVGPAASKTSTSASGGGGCISSSGAVSGSRSASKRSRLEQEKVKVVKMLVVVVMLFAVCWGPLLAQNVLVASGVLEPYHYGYLKPLRQALYLMSYLNSCLNPFVYGFMSAHFRASFRQALFSCCHFRLRKRIAFDTAASFRSRSTVVSFRCEARIHCGPRPCATRRPTTSGEEGDKGYSGVDSPSVSATSIEDRR